MRLFQSRAFLPLPPGAAGRLRRATGGRALRVHGAQQTHLISPLLSHDACVVLNAWFRSFVVVTLYVHTWPGVECAGPPQPPARDPCTVRACPWVLRVSVFICLLTRVTRAPASQTPGPDPHPGGRWPLAFRPPLWEANCCPAPPCHPLNSARYHSLLELGEKRKGMLEKSCKKFMLFREANELQQWINEKEAALTSEEVGADLEQVEVLQKKFDDFQKVRGLALG